MDIVHWTRVRKEMESLQGAKEAREKSAAEKTVPGCSSWKWSLVCQGLMANKLWREGKKRRKMRRRWWREGRRGRKKDKRKTCQVC